MDFAARVPTRPPHPGPPDSRGLGRQERVARLDASRDPVRYQPAGLMLLLILKKLVGSYFFLISASRLRLGPSALSTATSVPSPEIPVKFRYGLPVPNLLTSVQASRTQPT